MPIKPSQRRQQERRDTRSLAQPFVRRFPLSIHSPLFGTAVGAAHIMLTDAMSHDEVRRLTPTRASGETRAAWQETARGDIRRHEVARTLNPKVTGSIPVRSIAENSLVASDFA
ncbi:MAG TPA: hypothetical protein VFL67_19250, partial [Mycobacterium sp.]|nr:hypothetical protein [Mycobacterium sp.]